MSSLSVGNVSGSATNQNTLLLSEKQSPSSIMMSHPQLPSPPSDLKQLSLSKPILQPTPRKKSSEAQTERNNSRASYDLTKSKSVHMLSHPYSALEPVLPAFSLFAPPARLQCKPQMQTLVSHRGDSFISMHEDSVILAHSSLLEPDLIRERNLNSIGNKRPSHRPNYIKRLRDLQEPNGLPEEDEDEEDDDDLGGDEQGEVEDSIIQDEEEDEEDKEESIRNRDNTFEMKPPPPLPRPSMGGHEYDILEELALLNQVHIVTRQPRVSTCSTNIQNISTLSYRQKVHSPSPPSSTTNAGTAADKRKTSSYYQDRRPSQTSTSFEGRTVRVSTSETLFSLTSKQMTQNTTNTGLILPAAEKNSNMILLSVIPMEDEFMHASQMSESSSVLIVPDEPEKCLLKEPMCFSARWGSKPITQMLVTSAANPPVSAGAVAVPLAAAPMTAIVIQNEPAAKEIEKIPQKIKVVNKETYFVPSLLRCFQRGQKDKEQQLYWSYFMKTFQNYSQQAKHHFTEPHGALKHGSVYLPPLENSKKKTIFFDLDETLIHCIEMIQLSSTDSSISDLNFQIPFPTSPAKQSNASAGSGQIDMTPPSRNSDSCNEVMCYIKYSEDIHIKCLVSIRPHALEILKELAKDFELILLTAARKIYADAVLEKIDPEGVLFSHRFYRECCTEIRFSKTKGSHVGQKSFLKDLRIFQNRRPENIVLVDNSPLSFLQQISNGVPILDYCNDNKNDKELLHLSSFLKSILHVPDVREPIRQKFLLKHYKSFQRIEQLQDYLIQEYSNNNNNNNNQIYL